MAGLENLSDRDRAVLRSIFDPTATVGDVVDDGDTFAEDDDAGIEPAPLTSLLLRRDTKVVIIHRDQLGSRTLEHSTESVENLKDYMNKDSSTASVESIALCAQAVQLAESGKLQDALVAMNKGVAAAPDRPAAYNDRAQLLRLMLRDEEALADIDRAITLTEGKQTRARAQALCQRGVLLRKRGSDDEARAAFAEAAQLGSGFAKKQVVELNPYAALCNQMLSQVLKGKDTQV